MEEYQREHGTVMENYRTLFQMFPRANLDTLMEKCREIGPDRIKFQQLIEDSIKNPDILHKEIPKPKIGGGAQFKNLIDENSFDVQKFIFSLYTRDPVDYFDTLTRTNEHKKQLLEYLKHQHRWAPENHLEKVLTAKDFNLHQTIADIHTKNFKPSHENRLDVAIKSVTPLCESFIKEVTFVTKFDAIQQYLAERNDRRLAAQLAQQAFTCECCFSDDILEDEVMTCSEGLHLFCNICVKRYIDVELGDSRTKFPCFVGECQATIPMSYVKAVLNLKAYMKLCARIQEEEVKAANISGIEFCSACEYGAIPAEGDNLFTCIKCQTVTCRKCKREDHTPLQCGETAKDDRKKRARIEKEERKTNKILRRCSNCLKSYIKTSGCDVIHCECGTVQCYKCSAVLVEAEAYEHPCIVGNFDLY